jgi:Flp pilus assembly protein TadD
MKWLRAILLVNPYDKQAHEQLGLLLVAADRHHEALPEFEALIRLEPGNPQYQSHYALALDRTGRHDAARRAAERAVGLDPDCEAKKLLTDN